MSSIDANERNLTVPPLSETKRKVSIQEPRLSADNLGFDLHTRRKISQVE